MERKQLQTDDKLLFVQQLNSFCSRLTNASVRDQFAEIQQVSAKSFNNKMYGVRPFKGEELSIVERLYRQVLGDAEFDNQFTVFLQKRADGDFRTNEAAKDQHIKELAEINDELATAHLLVS
ncbi:hypothetical protein [Dyadobacter aurulentus]|uniref:hypothetical protein n=1 Tax=Dyadobacter sp. UC 10 TaxID=2605428 RepID=UPI0011F3E63E|nr:hypothetical protein [Dyadobacter sp. UC 10]KAA0992751.1 hypothetical protein FXO21_22530 [Dyadobacter sp. UC 10]